MLQDYWRGMLELQENDKNTYDWISTFREECKVIANKLSWIKEQKQSIEEFKKQKAPTIFNQINPDGYSIEKEKWSTSFEKLKKQADEALEHLEKIEESLI